MEPWIWVIICPIIAYFIGSIPFSYIITKLKTGKDLREVGTKNVGGLNTMITSGFLIGFFAGFCDFMKGLACLLTVLLLPFDNTIIIGEGRYSLNWHGLIYILVGATVVLGHNFSIYLKFHGGRGLGTSAGIFSFTNPLIIIIYLVIHGSITAITKYVRPVQFLGFVIIVPISFFIPIYPPWIVNNGLDSSLLLGLVASGIVLVTFPKYIKPVIDMFKGKEYTVGEKGPTVDENVRKQENKK